MRHQLAELLAAAGHDVLFLEKPFLPGWRNGAPRQGAGRIILAGHSELIHRKLRLAPFVHRLNAAVVRRSLMSAIAATGFPKDAVIVNFNYDYWFLREMFPARRLITIINDDFVSNALFGFTNPHHWALARTCAASDHVLTVSEPLRSDLAQYCHAQLFLPWADQAYRPPVEGTARDTLLFWGFINSKLDFPLIRNLADRLQRHRSALKLLFVGPVEQGVDGEVAALRKRSNVEVRAAMGLDQLPIERILAGMIPYRQGNAEIDAIALPNKALQLLARGIPLLIAGMPNFINAPFVVRLNNTNDMQSIDDLSVRFRTMQPAIQAFVSSNGATARLGQFMALVA